MYYRTLIALLALACAGTSSAQNQMVVGWRGDGSGHYPDANPPTVWYQKENGESKNILWSTKLPCYTWATPIIVGDKVFTLSEPYDLICLDKNTGKLLWVRSYPPFVAVTAAEKAANPAWKDVEPLVAELQKVNNEFVANGWTAEIYKKKYDLQKKINALTKKADGKYELPRDMYVESWGGYTGGTPCSDGQNVYVASGGGVTACYDLDGNRKWARFESVAAAWGEHGKACSPTLVGDKLLAMTMSLIALNKHTGEEIWTSKINAWDPYSIAVIKAGGVDFAVVSGNYVRVSDGKVVILRVGDMPGGMTVVNGNVVYYGGAKVSFSRYEAQPDGGLSVTPLIAEEYNRVNLPGGDNPKLKVDPSIANYCFTSSPLYHDGLLYCVGNFGKLVVVDTQKTRQKDAIVYGMFPPFDLKNPYSRKSFGFGIGASPILAGKYIYMIDSAGCTVVMEPGREFKLVAKNNIDYTLPEGWEVNYWMGPHHEQFEGSPIVDGNRLYMRGEQFLYCVGEK